MQLGKPYRGTRKPAGPSDGELLTKGQAIVDSCTTRAQLHVAVQWLRRAFMLATPGGYTEAMIGVLMRQAWQRMNSVRVT